MNAARGQPLHSTVALEGSRWGYLLGAGAVVVLVVGGSLAAGRRFG
jgi:hypothetical protein